MLRLVQSKRFKDQALQKPRVSKIKRHKFGATDEN
jgi:hypothetical protein